MVITIEGRQSAKPKKLPHKKCDQGRPTAQNHNHMFIWFRVGVEWKNRIEKQVD